MHNKSPVYISLVEIIQKTTGITWKWVTFPGIIIPGIIIFALLDRLSIQHRLLVTGVSLFGPLTSLQMVFSLRRDLFDIVIILSTILLLRAIERYDAESIEYFRGPRFIPVTLFIASGLLWGIHYSVWPFLSAFGGFYLLSYWKNWRGSLFSGLALIISPIAIYSPPLRSYVPGIGLIFESFSSPTTVIEIIYNLGFSRGSRITDGGMIVPPLSSSLGAITITQYIIYFSLSLLAAVPLLRYIVYIVRNKSIDNSIKFEIRTFTVALLALCTTVALLLFQGYFNRIFFFWAIMFPLFGLILYTVFETDSLSSRWDYFKMISTILIVVILVTQLGLIAVYPSIEGSPTTQQFASSSHAKYVPSNTPIYTDLTHGSLIKLTTERDKIRTGTSTTLSNRSIRLNGPARLVYDPSGLSDGIVVKSVSGDSTVTWRGKIPVQTTHTYNKNRIYSNGGEIWYYQ